MTRPIHSAAKHQALVIPFLAVALLFLEMLTAAPAVQASLCQVSDVSYNFPAQVAVSQSFTVSTTVRGSCAEYDYPYSLRVSVVDRNSGRVISSTRTSIPSANPSNFVVTATNSVTAPAEASAAWELGISVAIFSITDTGLQDSVPGLVMEYSTVGFATIQVGSVQAVPEFPAQNPALVLTLAVTLAAVLILKPRKDT